MEGDDSSSDALDGRLSDYGAFDFEATWSGRGRVIELERAIVASALSSDRPRRTLELGVGFGRLTPAIRAQTDEYVGVDLDRASLLKFARSTRTNGSLIRASWLAEANAFHLPFVDGAFDAIVVVRLYHHFEHPGRVLREARRCLASRGRLVLQFSPKPTIGTLTMDVQRALSGRFSGRGPVTLSKEAVVAVEGERFPLFVPRRDEVLRELAEVGLPILAEWGTGPERLQRWMPIGAQLRLARIRPQSAWFPSRFILAGGTGRPNPAFPGAQAILACPRCSAPLGPQPNNRPWRVDCSRCGFSVAFDGEVLRARYTPATLPQRGDRAPP